MVSLQGSLSAPLRIPPLARHPCSLVLFSSSAIFSFPVLLLVGVTGPCLVRRRRVIGQVGQCAYTSFSFFVTSGSCGRWWGSAWSINCWLGLLGALAAAWNIAAIVGQDIRRCCRRIFGIRWSCCY